MRKSAQNFGVDQIAEINNRFIMLMALIMPMALMVAAMFFASMLFSVRDCFATDVYDEPPASADRPD